MIDFKEIYNNMKQYEKIQKEIAECDSAMEMAGYLNGINVAAVIFCKQNYPDEVCITESGESEISVYGMKYFLENEV